MNTPTVSTWFGDVTSRPRAVAYPRSVEEVVAIMRDAETYPSPVRAIGSRHSTTACGSADGGTMVFMRHMDRILHLGDDTITVEAGALIVEVAKELRRHNLQFYVNTVIGNATIGSAACCGTKDSSMPGEFGQVCSYVTSMTMVTPSGGIVDVTEDEPDLLQAMRSSHGLFGIVTRVTLKVKPLQSMSVHHKTYSLDEFERRLPALSAGGESMMLFSRPFKDKITVEFRRYEGNRSPRDASAWQWGIRNVIWKTVAPSLGYGLTRYVPVKSARHATLDAFYRLVALFMDRVLKGANTIPSDQIIRYSETSTSSKYTFSIWAFPEERYPAILRAYFRFCRDYYRSAGYRTDMIDVGYCVGHDTSSLLSYSAGGTVMTIDPVSTGGPGWEEFLRAYNDFCSRHGGVPLLNQSPLLTPEHVQLAFGDRIAALDAYRLRFDPAGRLLSPYYADLLGLPRLPEGGGDGSVGGDPRVL